VSAEYFLKMDSKCLIKEGGGKRCVLIFNKIREDVHLENIH
jgi:hypothetical protein